VPTFTMNTPQTRIEENSKLFKWAQEKEQKKKVRPESGGRPTVQRGLGFATGMVQGGDRQGRIGAGRRYRQRKKKKRYLRMKSARLWEKQLGFRPEVAKRWKKTGGELGEDQKKSWHRKKPRKSGEASRGNWPQKGEKGPGRMGRNLNNRQRSIKLENRQGDLQRLAGGKKSNQEHLDKFTLFPGEIRGRGKVQKGKKSEKVKKNGNG